MSRAQGFRAGIFLFETIAGPKHWMLGTCAWSYWHGIMVWVILNRERERERLRFLLQERKVQMVVLKEKNVNDDNDDPPPLQ